MNHVSKDSASKLATADFLFELGCEELPSAAVLALSAAFTANVTKILVEHGLKYEAITSFATPRRLALYVKALAAAQAAHTISKRGPAVVAAYDLLGKPTAALLGFAKSCGVAHAQLSIIKTDKGDWVSYEAWMPGIATTQLLPVIIQEALANLPIAKPMRWGDGSAEFARPIHWVVMLYGEQFIPCKILGVDSGQVSYGHRFHHPAHIFIPKAADYESLLHMACVIVDFNKRRQVIIEQIQALAQQVQAITDLPTALLDEVTSIVEWPQALLAQFDHDFLSMPQEVLRASMQAHQKCFALVGKDDNLLPKFITVANIESQKPTQVVAGNEKVMRARLNDAAFFFAQDQKHSLASYIPATKKVIFQASLGSLYDKAQRIKILMQFLLIPLHLNADEVIRAAELCKCDLLTGMVGEFPLLQGVMGYYYAKLDGEAPSVALALQEQYLPRFAADFLPRSVLGTALSLADRLDTLVGSFLLGDKPSGVKDPYKLRRHALAVARLLIDKQIILSLSALIQAASFTFQEAVRTSEKSQLNELATFILERLAAYYQGQGIKIELVNAVFARQNDNLFDLDKRLHALAYFVKQPEAEILSAACKRVNNLLNSTIKDVPAVNAINTLLLHEPAELNLFRQLETIEAKVQALDNACDYQAMLTLLSSLRTNIDVFFAEVMVLVEDMPLKHNRLVLLKRLQGLLQYVADISLL